MSLDQTQNEKIESFLFKIIESEEYLAIKYLVFSIRKCYLHYLTKTRLQGFPIPDYLKELVEYVDVEFERSTIAADEILAYMLVNDINGWVHYYACTFIAPIGKEDGTCSRELFMLVLTAYFLDCFSESTIDIQSISDGEVLAHETNQYGLTVVNGVEFKRDYFVFENKAYLYNVLTNTEVIYFTDTMPAFAKIISDRIKEGNILLRLDERLALPVDQAISYSALNFQKFHGPQFYFKDSVLKAKKTIIVHIDEETFDKLLMVIKQEYDDVKKQPFLHIEIETLPYADGQSEGRHRITTFLHGMYYPETDSFNHIDYTRNQYDLTDYKKKYSESSPDVPIDLYTSTSKLHYKIWCVENGSYSREVWYDLMSVSLSEQYRRLLDEILE